VASPVVEQAPPLVAVSLVHHALGAMRSKQRHRSADPTLFDALLLVRSPMKRPMPNDVQRMTPVRRKMMH
jgi:hypothetical protein